MKNYNAKAPELPMNCQDKSLDEILDIYEENIANFKYSRKSINEYISISTKLNNIFVETVGHAYNNFYVVGIHESNSNDKYNGKTKKKIRNIEQLSERISQIHEVWVNSFPDINESNKNIYPIPPGVLYYKIKKNLLEELSSADSLVEKAIES